MNGILNCHIASLLQLVESLPALHITEDDIWDYFQAKLLPGIIKYQGEQHQNVMMPDTSEDLLRKFGTAVVSYLKDQTLAKVTSTCVEAVRVTIFYLSCSRYATMSCLPK